MNTVLNRRRPRRRYACPCLSSRCSPTSRCPRPRGSCVRYGRRRRHRQSRGRHRGCHRGCHCGCGYGCGCLKGIWTWLWSRFLVSEIKKTIGIRVMIDPLPLVPVLLVVVLVLGLGTGLPAAFARARPRPKHFALALQTTQDWLKCCSHKRRKKTFESMLKTTLSFGLGLVVLKHNQGHFYSHVTASTRVQATRHKKLRVLVQQGVSLAHIFLFEVGKKRKTPRELFEKLGSLPGSGPGP